MTKHVLRRIPAVLVVCALLSCGGEDGGSGPDPDDAIASVTVSPGTTSVDLGDDVQLSASAVDGRGDPVSTTFTWSSTDEGRASVSSSGLVTGLGEGPVTIRATAEGRTGQAEVTVNDPDPPQGAGGLQVTPLSDTEVELTWDDESTNEDEYRIERETVGAPLEGPARAYAQVATVGAGVTSYVDDGLDPSASYRYRVSACNQNGCSAFTSEVEGTTHETLEIVTTSLPEGVLDVAYEHALEASGGDGPPTWSIAAGALPAGLALDAGGLLSGTPTAAGTFDVAVQAEGAGQTRTRELSLTVSEVILEPQVSTTQLPEGGVGATYSAQLQASRGDGVYAWAIAGGALPAGLSMSTSGAITGTPSAEGATAAVFEVTSAGMTASAELDIVVHPALAVATTTLPDGVEGVAYDAALVADGGDGTVGWSLESGELPEGLSLDEDGMITGTPTAEPAEGGAAAVGTSTFVVRAESGVGQVATQELVITVNGELVITTTELADGQVTVAYDQAIEREGGDGDDTWSITGGDLPAGLSLGVADGVVSGTPEEAGTFTFTVQVQSGDGQVAAANLEIDVATAPVTVTTTTLSAGNVGVAYAETLEATGGDGSSYTWSITSGELPTGLGLTAGTGEITGTPSAAGTFEFTVEAESGGESDDQALSITVTTHPPVEVLTTSLPNGTQGVGYLRTVEATGGDGSFTWAVTTGSLPAGLSLNASTGQISGTPTTVGMASFTVEATSAGDSDDQALSITIVSGDPLTIETLFLPIAYSGAAYSGTVATQGGEGGNTFSVAAGSLPAGLSLNAATGAITGTPGGAGTAHVTIQVTDGVSTVSHTYMLTVSGASPAAFNFHMHNIAGVMPAAPVQAALDHAVSRWEEVITGNITNVGPIAGLPGHFCSGFAAEYDGRVIDDIEVFLDISNIDGPGGTLASAGPCTTTTRGGRTLPILGIVTLDASDLGNLDAAQLRGVIFHELGHVIGIGTLWSSNGFLDETIGADPRYTGAQGVSEYQVGLSGPDPDVPVENTGGDGTAGGHWRESIFDTEVMTGYAEAPGTAQPVSILTIGGVADLGYVVNLGAADAYAIPGPPAPGAPAADQGQPPLDDIWKGPVAFLMPDGTVKVLRLGGS